MLKIRNFILTVKQFQWERAEVNPFCVYVSDLEVHHRLTRLADLA